MAPFPSATKKKLQELTKTWPDTSTIRFCYISQYMTITHFHEILWTRGIQKERKGND